jgi:hypothetical protein
MGAPGGDAKHFLEWANEEGAEVALGAALAELRLAAGQNLAPERLAELLAVAEILLARITEELREGRRWAARRRAAHDVIAKADAEVRRAMESEAAILSSERKRNGAEKAAMIAKAGKEIVERLWHPSQTTARNPEVPTITTADALASAAVELRSVAAETAVGATTLAILGDEEPGAALVAADDALRGIRGGHRRDEELIGLAACLLEALRRSHVPLDAAARDVAEMLEARSVVSPNWKPMIADAGAVRRWRNRLSEGAGPANGRQRIWRAFIGWADAGHRLPSWLARTAQQLRKAIPSEEQRARLAVLRCAPSRADRDGWRQVASEVRKVLRGRLSR